MKTILRNCTLITDGFDVQQRYDICMHNGIIEQIGAQLETEDAKVLDLEGNIVLPGFIDMHCNICEPGYENV